MTDLSKYDGKADVKIRLSCGRLHLYVNGFVVASEGTRCWDSDLQEIPSDPPCMIWTKERLTAVLGESGDGTI